MAEQDIWERQWSAVGVRLVRKPGETTSADSGDALQLPSKCFTSSESFNMERIGALAMYCSDGRWGEAFDEFCHRALTIPRYDRFAVPGGPMCLVDAPDRDAALREAVRGQLDLLVRVHGLRRIVLITHYGCAAYTESMRRKAEECLPLQLTDTVAAVKALREWFPGLRVEGYLAMRRETEMTFHGLGGF